MLNGLLSLLIAGNLSASNVNVKSDLSTFDDRKLLKVEPLPQQKEYILPDDVSAKSVFIIDLKSKSRLYTYNEEAKRPIASLTKLMTADIILEENDLSAIVKINSQAANSIGSKMGLSDGEEISVKDLLKGMLINSGNDAATALAIYNAGDVMTFVNKMNEHAALLGMKNTIYKNPTGLDSNGAVSTAYDQGLLASHLLDDDLIRTFINIQSTEVLSESGNIHTLQNTNKLLGEMGVKGMKTGRTDAAGECLITLSESPDGNEVLTIVLGSQRRFKDTKTLLDWVYQTFTW